MKSKDDRVIKQPGKDVSGELSPMDPPDSYFPPAQESVPYEEMHPFLQELMEEHKRLSEELGKLEETLILIRERGVEKETNARLRNFFEFFDDHVISHHKKEERLLFPVLEKKFIEKGEHSKGPQLTTPVDVMEDDHIKGVQLAATVFNLFALSGRLPDHNSRLIVLDLAIEQGMSLVEMLRLHIFREDSVIFPVANKHIDIENLDNMLKGRVK